MVRHIIVVALLKRATAVSEGAAMSVGVTCMVVPSAMHIGRDARVSIGIGTVLVVIEMGSTKRTKA